jgi:phenylpyruvate tautomerase PptA (4-oxalocrotonate tautomerase family)
MPLVRIDTRKNPDPARIGRIGKVVYETMNQAINVPDHDNFQVLAEHDDAHLIYDPGYLGIPRSDGFVMIQITLSEGRTVDQKKALYEGIVQRLKADLGVRIEDVFINLVEVKKENWSFGNGVAQYVQ